MHLARPALAAIAVLALALTGCVAEDSDASSTSKTPSASPAPEFTPFAEVSSEGIMKTSEDMFMSVVEASQTPDAEIDFCPSTGWDRADYANMQPSFQQEGSTIEVASWDVENQYRVRGALVNAEGQSDTGQAQVVVDLTPGEEPCIISIGSLFWRQ